MEKQVITKDTLIQDVVNLNPDSVAILQNYGMHCLGCALAHGETVGEAADVHGADLVKMLEELKTPVEE